MILVVDCSFIMSSLLPDEVGCKADAIYRKIASKLYEVYVPAIFYLECNNVLISSLKKERITKSDYEEYLSVLNKLPVTNDNFSCYPESLHTIGRLANTYNLTSYDAAYLELTIRLKAQIATLDKAITNTCKILNIKLAL